MVDFSVLHYKDVRLALGAMMFNTTIVIAAWFGRVYWMHAIESVVNKLQVRAYDLRLHHSLLQCKLPVAKH